MNLNENFVIFEFAGLDHVDWVRLVRWFCLKITPSSVIAFFWTVSVSCSGTERFLPTAPNIQLPAAE